MAQSTERLLPKDWPFTSAQFFIISFTSFMPSTRNDEDQTKASLAGRLSIHVPALMPLMNKPIWVFSQIGFSQKAEFPSLCCAAQNVDVFTGVAVWWQTDGFERLDRAAVLNTCQRSSCNLGASEAVLTFTPWTWLEQQKVWNMFLTSKHWSR